jgi:DNA topoisomerase-3
MEVELKAICQGTRSRHDVVQTSLEQYREVYVKTLQGMGVIKEQVRRYVLGSAR